MRVGVLGINFKSSDLQVRETLAKASRRCFDHKKKHVARLSCILLSTCNRTEIYFSAPDLAAAQSELLHILREEIDFPFEHKLYSYFGGDCFFHLAVVTAGLDSAIIAETEIQKQVKMAYAHACLHHRLPSCMHFMFQKSLKIGKSIRTSFPLSSDVSSLEKMIFHLAKQIHQEERDMSILFVGNSEINRKILTFFQTKGMRDITLCTRAVHSAEERHIKIVNWSELPFWSKYDLIICGTNYHEYLIYPEPMSCHNKVIFDLSVPRNVDPRLSRHPHIHLFNIEELGGLIHEKRRHQLHEMEKMEKMIRTSAERQLALYHLKTQNKASLSETLSCATS